MTDYDPRRIEDKWSSRWEGARVFATPDPEPGRKPYYCLEMLPYPSGRLHMGHVRNYAIGDAVARFRRMRGERLMHVIGWDAFGLPAENAAIQSGEDPRRWTRRNIDTMRAQLGRLGFSYDWDREIATCDPEYYRWNQWFFLRMLERGIAYRARRLQNWCSSCATVLANEQVIGGRCWRCEGAVSRREFQQWFLRITDYAQALLDGLDRLPAWPEKVRAMQRNWIGRSEGAQVSFPVEGADEKVEVFTTRLDTIFGATAVVLAVEHPAIETLIRGTEGEAAVRGFVLEQLARTLDDRFAEAAEKLGVFTGRYAIHPYSGERLPIWVANFVLMEVGTGAIMSVPAHDQRDLEFARKYRLEVKRVVVPSAHASDARADAMTEAWPDDGILVSSGPYSSLESAAARQRMVADAASKGFGRSVVQYRLKDWGVSRQRYWGTPIPVVHCERCGIVGVRDEDLPVLLPESAPLTGEGGSPLSRLASFVEAACPRCGGPARRDTDTMDTFVDSCWYYFRYLDPKNARAPFDSRKVKPWLPVDLYIGGIEHATLHLIYTRFWTRMMRDLGLVEIDEPVTELFTQGMVIKDGAKMSKSKGNVVDPDHMVERFGADTTRLFSLFAAPPERDLEWSEAGVEGCARFLSRVWRTFARVRGRLPARGAPMPRAAMQGTALALRRKTHRTIARVTADLGPRMHLNTAVAAIMELTNVAAPLSETDADDPGIAWALREAFEALARILSPFAPHFAEEIWEALDGDGLVLDAGWPEADASVTMEEEVTIVVQVNGKLRSRLTLARGATEGEAIDAARADDRVAPHLAGRTLCRAVYVADRLLNLVVA